MCNSFIDYFKSKIVSIHNTIIGKLPTLSSPPLNRAHVGPTLEVPSPVSPEQVLAILNSIPAKSSPLDFIPTSLLKSCSGVFSLLISRLANLSFSQGVFPTKFKVAQVTPILKKPGLPSSDSANFRPISNLNNISKILERLFFPTYFPTSTLVPISTLFNPPTDLTILLKLHSRLLLTIFSMQLTTGLLLSYYYYYEHFSAQGNTGTANALM